MGQINSGIATKACVYDFSKNGALGPAPVYSWSGIEMKPGEAIMSIRASKVDNLTSAAGPGTNFGIVWGPNPDPTGFASILWFDTLANINTMFWTMSKSFTFGKDFNDQLYYRIPSQTSLTQSLWFTSDQLITGGRVVFVVTYMYAKF